MGLTFIETEEAKIKVLSLIAKYKSCYPFNPLHYDDDFALINPKFKGNYKITKMIVDGIEIPEPKNYVSVPYPKEAIISLTIDISNTSSLEGMFSNICELLSINFTEQSETKHINNMDEMFRGCNQLRFIDVSHLNTENIVTMKGMFEYCKNLKNIDLKSFDTKNIESTANLFRYCESLTSIDISNFNLKKIKICLVCFQIVKTLKK